MRYFRFQVLHTYGNRSDGRVFAMSEFQIHPVNMDEEASPYYQKPWVKEAFDALQQCLQETRAHIINNDITPENNMALRQAIERAEEALLITDGIEDRAQDERWNRKEAGTLYDLSGRRLPLYAPTPSGIYLLRNGQRTQKVVK